MSQVIAPARISSIDEQPAFFEAGAETLFGILTRPRAQERDSALIMVPSAERLGYRNRVGAMLSHGLAERGHQAFRFNYRGCGESTGKAGRFRIADLFTTDAVGATAWLRGQGVERFLYSGSCFGARTALAAAAQEPATAGVILVAMPLTDSSPGEYGRLTPAGTARPSLARRALRLQTLRDLRDPDLRRLYREAVRIKLRRMARRSVMPTDPMTTISPQVLRSLTSLVERRVQILFLYGERDHAHAEFLEASKTAAFGDLLEQAGDAVQIRVLPGQLHGWVSIPVGATAVDHMIDWVSRVDRRTQPV